MGKSLEKKNPLSRKTIDVYILYQSTIAKGICAILPSQCMLNWEGHPDTILNQNRQTIKVSIETGILQDNKLCLGAKQCTKENQFDGTVGPTGLWHLSKQRY